LGDEARTLADVLCQAIRASGVSEEEVSRRTGIPAPVISWFVSSKHDLTLRTADRMAASWVWSHEPGARRKASRGTGRLRPRLAVWCSPGGCNPGTKIAVQTKRQRSTGSDEDAEKEEHKLLRRSSVY
jgi:hypothetical protein